MEAKPRRRTGPQENPPVTEELLREMTCRIREAGDPIQIILFGSHARGGRPPQRPRPSGGRGRRPLPARGVRGVPHGPAWELPLQGCRRAHPAGNCGAARTYRQLGASGHAGRPRPLRARRRPRPAAEPNVDERGVGRSIRVVPQGRERPGHRAPDGGQRRPLRHGVLSRAAGRREVPERVPHCLRAGVSLHARP